MRKAIGGKKAMVSSRYEALRKGVRSPTELCKMIRDTSHDCLRCPGPFFAYVMAAVEGLGLPQFS